MPIFTSKLAVRQRLIAGVRAQFGHPVGFWGRAVDLVMAYRPSNGRRNAWAVSLLDVRPEDRVLEIGFGPGRAISKLSRLAPKGYVCGVDHSEAMLRSARRRNADAVRRGSVDLFLASVESLPAFESPFDKILAVNSMMFWKEPEARLVELGRLLRPGGVIAIAHQPRGPGVTDDTSATEGRKNAAALARAGFSDIRVEALRLKPAAICAIGTNPLEGRGKGRPLEAEPD